MRRRAVIGLISSLVLAGHAQAQPPSAAGVTATLDGNADVRLLEVVQSYGGGPALHTGRGVTRITGRVTLRSLLPVTVRSVELFAGLSIPDPHRHPEAAMVFAPREGIAPGSTFTVPLQVDIPSAVPGELGHAFGIRSDVENATAVTLRVGAIVVDSTRARLDPGEPGPGAVLARLGSGATFVVEDRFSHADLADAEPTVRGAVVLGRARVTITNGSTGLIKAADVGVFVGGARGPTQTIPLDPPLAPGGLRTVTLEVELPVPGSVTPSAGDALSLSALGTPALEPTPVLLQSSVDLLAEGALRATVITQLASGSAVVELTPGARFSQVRTATGVVGFVAVSALQVPDASIDGHAIRGRRGARRTAEGLYVPICDIAGVRARIGNDNYLPHEHWRVIDSNVGFFRVRLYDTGYWTSQATRTTTFVPYGEPNCPFVHETVVRTGLRL